MSQIIKSSFEIYWVMAIVLKWVSTHYYLDEHHLIIYKGILRIEEHVYELQSIRSVDHSESWLGKLVNYGDIALVFGASGYKEDIVLRGITDPKKYERIFSSFLGVESRRFISHQEGGEK
jgi:uncharacterized membrane protein YdbT with pleckstrin-like domain